MDREGIKQRVLDTLGIILVDKSYIHEEATFAELVLDDADVNELFKRLEDLFDCRLPGPVRERARLQPEHVSLPMLVDLLVLMQQKVDLPGRPARKSMPATKRRP